MLKGRMSGIVLYFAGIALFLAFLAGISLLQTLAVIFVANMFAETEWVFSYSLWLGISLAMMILKGIFGK